MGLKDPNIRVDSEGRWHSDYGEVSHPGVRRYFQSIVKREGGRYILDNGKSKVPVEAEGFIFFVEALREKEFKGRPWLWLVINDDTEEPLDPSSLEIREDNSVVCRIKGGKIPAKFTLSAYWQLVEHVVEKEGKFYLSMGGELFPLGGGDD